MLIMGEMLIYRIVDRKRLNLQDSHAFSTSNQSTTWDYRSRSKFGVHEQAVPSSAPIKISSNRSWMAQEDAYLFERVHEIGYRWSGVRQFNFLKITITISNKSRCYGF